MTVRAWGWAGMAGDGKTPHGDLQAVSFPPLFGSAWIFRLPCGMEKRIVPA